jgi:spore germination cell wall hydrolase CwlJ-like protein
MPLAVPLFAVSALGVANVVAEAGNQPLHGMIAVAEVVRNRMERRYQSNGSVHDTIFRPKQFSWTNESTPWRANIFGLTQDDPRVQLAQRAWQIAFGGDERSDIAKGAVLYHTVRAPRGAKRWPPIWAIAPTVIEVVRIGDHIFYDDRPRGK